jgi:hypothetical protein
MHACGLVQDAQGQAGRQGSRREPKAWEPEEVAALLDRVLDRFPLGQFTWKKRLEEFGEC